MIPKIAPKSLHISLSAATATWLIVLSGRPSERTWAVSANRRSHRSSGQHAAGRRDRRGEPGSSWNKGAKRAGLEGQPRWWAAQGDMRGVGQRVPPPPVPQSLLSSLSRLEAVLRTSERGRSSPSPPAGPVAPSLRRHPHPEKAQRESGQLAHTS